jgi:ParB-like chromosome segregation protein Spo0J
MLEEGRYGSISEMAKAEGVERGYVGSLLRLTLLPPEVVEAILDGRQPEGITLPGLLERVPAGWGEQATRRVKASKSLRHPRSGKACKLANISSK